MRALTNMKTKGKVDPKTEEHTIANFFVVNASLALFAPVNYARLPRLVELYANRPALAGNAVLDTGFIERVCKDAAAWLIQTNADKFKDSLRPGFRGNRRKVGGLVLKIRRAVREHYATHHAKQNPEFKLHATTGAPISAPLDDSIHEKLVAETLQDSEFAALADELAALLEKMGKPAELSYEKAFDDVLSAVRNALEAQRGATAPGVGDIDGAPTTNTLNLTFRVEELVDVLGCSTLQLQPPAQPQPQPQPRGLGGGLSGRKKKPLPPTNEWGGNYTVVPRPLDPPFAALPQQLLPTESVVSGSIVLAPEVESPGAYGAGLGAGFGADFGDLGGLETLLDGTLGGSTVMGRGMAWHAGHGMAAPAPGLEPLFGLGPLSRLTELTPIGPDGAQLGAAFHEAPEPRMPSRAGSSRTSRLVTEGELARVASEAHARGFASGAAAGSAHGLVKGMEIGAGVASKTVTCLADRFVDLENKIEKSGQAVLKAVEQSSNETLEAVEEVREAVEKSGQEVLKAVEQSSNETLEAVEEVREAVEETRFELKEGFIEVANAFMHLEESVLDGLDALEDRQAELRKAERAARREISAGEAQRHAALYGKVSEIAARVSGAVRSAGFDAGVEKKKPEEATMEVAHGEAERVAKRQASAEWNSVKRRKDASRERCHILPFPARRSFATPPLSPSSKAKANRGL